jgi:hypothetical protein
MKTLVTVYVGDVTEYLAHLAFKHDPNALLITVDNHENLSSGTYYVNLGDLKNLNQLGTVLRQADHIIYAPPERWSDSIFGSSRMKEWTEDYVSTFATDSSKIIDGLQFQDLKTPEMLDIADVRQGAEPQIWIAGCSISHGVGVDQNQRYGKIISQELGMHASFLTCPGSSVSWAADQILRSDIRKKDVIFWGVTGASRFTHWNDIDNKIQHCTASEWEQRKTYLQQIIHKKFLTSDHMIYQCVNSINQVHNVCNKLGIKLIIGTLIAGLEKYLRNLSGFLPLGGIHGRNPEDIYPDLGTDNLHPGPITHRYYADKMLEKFREG